MVFGLAAIYFVIFHQIFDVFYFGFKGLSGTIIGCVFASIMTIGLVVKYWIWILGIGGIGFLLVKLGSKSE